MVKKLAITLGIPHKIQEGVQGLEKSIPLIDVLAARYYTNMVEVVQEERRAAHMTSFRVHNPC